LKNARDLLRYGAYQTPLGEPVRILAILDDLGSMSFADAVPLFREIQPMAGLASPILCRFPAD
jgi:hypothetical protein